MGYRTVVSTMNYANGRSFARAVLTRLVDHMAQEGMIDRDEANTIKKERIMQTGSPMNKKKKKKESPAQS